VMRARLRVFDATTESEVILSINSNNVGHVLAGQCRISSSHHSQIVLLENLLLSMAQPLEYLPWLNGPWPNFIINYQQWDISKLPIVNTTSRSGFQADNPA